MPEKITYQVAKERFDKQGRTDVVLCEDEYVSFTKPAKFFDIVANDYFWAVPKSVFNRNSVHPKRTTEKRKETCLIRYGVENPNQNKEIKEKTKKTNQTKYGSSCSLHGNTEEGILVKEKTKQTLIKRYGKDSYLQSENYKVKSKITSLKKFGVSYFVQTEESQKHIKEVVLEQYGVKNISQSEKVKKQKKETLALNWGVQAPLASKELLAKKEKTCFEKYGVKSYSQTDEYKSKYKKTCLKKFGIENGGALNKKKIIETSEWLEDWLEKQPQPKPTYTTFSQNFISKIEVTLQDAQSCLERMRESKTALERRAEEIFEVNHYNRKPDALVKTYKPDFLMNSNIFINVDGLYWHSEASQKDKWYHFNLRKAFEESKLRIFQFREDEIYHKSEIIKSIVSNSLGKTSNKIFARKCKIKLISQKEANSFLEENHLMGSTTAKHIGLFYINELVSILSFKQKANICKIERFCSKLNLNVVGGFSKMLSCLEQEHLNGHITQIHNWVDLRYGTGNHLQNKGFYLARETLGWKWTDGVNSFNRLSCRANMDDRKLSQFQHASELGWYKIYDAGQRLWIKKLI